VNEPSRRYLNTSPNKMVTQMVARIIHTEQQHPTATTIQFTKDGQCEYCRHAMEEHRATTDRGRNQERDASMAVEEGCEIQANGANEL